MATDWSRWMLSRAHRSALDTYLILPLSVGFTVCPQWLSVCFCLCLPRRSVSSLRDGFVSFPYQLMVYWLTDYCQLIAGEAVVVGKDNAFDRKSFSFFFLSFLYFDLSFIALFFLYIAAVPLSIASSLRFGATLSLTFWPPTTTTCTTDCWLLSRWWKSG